jgi:hypothetical protein
MSLLAASSTCTAAACTAGSRATLDTTSPKFGACVSEVVQGYSSTPQQLKAHFEAAFRATSVLEEEAWTCSVKDSHSEFMHTLRV